MSLEANPRIEVFMATHFHASVHYTSMSGRRRSGLPKGSDADSTSVAETRTETALLTADLLLRGRRRARALVEPAIAEAARASGSATDLRSLLAVGSRRDVALAFIWMAIFAGCFLLVRWSDS